MFRHFANHDYEAEYPSLWKGCVLAYCPSITGPTGTRLYDLAINRKHGTLANMDPATDWVYSQGRRALDFDGGNDYITTGISTLTSYIQRPCAVSLWFKTHIAVTTRQVLIADWDTAGTAQSLRMEISGFGMTAGRVGGEFAGATSGTVVQSTAGITSGVWYHAVLQATSATVSEFWLGGLLRASGTIPASVPTVTNQTLTLGRAGAFNGLYLNGQLDDIRIYKRSLTAGEIRRLSLRRGIAYTPQDDWDGTANAYRRRMQAHQLSTVGVVG